MIETLLLALAVVCAPVPRPRAKVEPPLAGVYICEGVSFEAIVWFSQDGKYGSRWGDSLYEGKWHFNKVTQTIEIRERKLGTTEALHPWSLPAPGKKGGTYELRKIAALP